MGNRSTKNTCADTIAQSVLRYAATNTGFMTAFGHLLAFAEVLSVAVGEIKISLSKPNVFRTNACVEILFESGGPHVGFGFRQYFELAVTGDLAGGEPTVEHAMLIQHPLIYGRGEQDGRPDYDPIPTIVYVN